MHGGRELGGRSAATKSVTSVMQIKTQNTFLQDRLLADTAFINLTFSFFFFSLSESITNSEAVRREGVIKGLGT